MGFFSDKSFLGEYRRSTGGKYVYTGAFYRTADPKKARLAAAFCAAAACVFAALSGLIREGGMLNTFYVLLTYIGEVASAFALAWTSARFAAGCQRTTEHNYLSFKKNVPAACVSLCVFSAAGAAASAVFLILNGTGGSPLMCAALLLLKLASFLDGLFYRRFFVKLVWEKV